MYFDCVVGGGLLFGGCFVLNFIVVDFVEFGWLADWLIFGVHSAMSGILTL